MALAERGTVLGTSTQSRIINTERGAGGLGYDALSCRGHCETFAQLPAAVKNQLSHAPARWRSRTVPLGA